MCSLVVPSLFWPLPLVSSFFFFNDTATTEIYTLSPHDALPIYGLAAQLALGAHLAGDARHFGGEAVELVDHRIDRKSTRLNSSHRCISYAVFCLKKKKDKYNSMYLNSTINLHQENDIDHRLHLV